MDIRATRLGSSLRSVRGDGRRGRVRAGLRLVADGSARRQVFDDLEKMTWLDGFSQIDVDSRFFGRPTGFGRRVRAQRDNPQSCFIQMRHPVQLDYVETAYARHVDVDDEDVEVRVFQRVESLLAARDENSRMFSVLQDALGDLLIDRIVLGDENAQASAFSRPRLVAFPLGRRGKIAESRQDMQGVDQRVAVEGSR